MGIGDAWALHQADPLKRKVAIGDGSVVDDEHPDLLHGLESFLATQAEADAGGALWAINYRSGRPYVDYAAMKLMLRRLGLHVDKNKKMVKRLGRYIWNLNYRPSPAPIVLTPQEEEIAAAWSLRGPYVILEPYIKAGAPPSKQYPVKRFQEVAIRLNKEIPVYQIGSPGSVGLPGLPQIRPSSFRQSMAFLKNASLFIGPEGGLHHASAAMGTPAVVIFGGFVSPLITGYDSHTNLTGGADYACGTRYGMCPHCEEAFARITPDDVLAASRRHLGLDNPHD